jgi:uncharacterized repeat protein (TIGR01451 family)
VALALVAGAGGNALAFLETGTLLTNAASATYMGGGQGTQVTYSATAKILVANPAVFMWKDVNPTFVGTVGGWVTYIICFSNGGANTAFNLMMTDRVPYGSAGVAIGVNSKWVVGSGATVAATYSIVGPTGPFTTALASPAGLTSTAGGLWLHWVASRVDIGASGCITFEANILP